MSSVLAPSGSLRPQRPHHERAVELLRHAAPLSVQDAGFGHRLQHALTIKVPRIVVARKVVT